MSGVSSPKAALSGGGLSHSACCHPSYILTTRMLSWLFLRDTRFKAIVGREFHRPITRDDHIVNADQQRALTRWTTVDIGMGQKQRGPAMPERRWEMSNSEHGYAEVCRPTVVTKVKDASVCLPLSSPIPYTNFS